ncbi:hypothetical protein [Methanobrevibacter sp.]|uniref:hypothetical protein n=1 Tax=Methanobrevibacter sp. TaxID=66852 RepID=UPI0025EB490F|nr:hypothetical protein [Methanobrevibacter sp.]MBR4447897.1 hypothetical protein [Methanobrevibacter sp.]
MKLSLAIIYGVLIWIFTSILTNIFNPIFTSNIPGVNIIVPIITIIVTTFFGILYIRNIETNEVIEGVVGGMMFVIIDIILDYIFYIIPNAHSAIIGNYPIHLLSIAIITLSITTLLGYLAQMTIDLK